jgi:transketolase
METPLPTPVRLARNPKKSPMFKKDIRRQNGETIAAADPSAIRSLVALMGMQAQMGGAASHFGGPSALAEINSALHALVFNTAEKESKQWFDLYNLVNDAGHCENGLYALKALYGFADLTIDSLKPFRSIKSNLTGHGEAHLFPEGVQISNGPLGSGLPQAEGLALADKLLGNSRVTVCTISDGGCMEGEAREALASIPGLAANGKMNPFVMVISDNNTKLTGRIDKDSFSMQPTFAALASLGWNVIRLEKGHDLQACADAFEKAFVEAKKDPTQPVALHVKTIKGFGTKKTAESSSGAHGFPLTDPNDLAAFISEIYAGQNAPAEFTQWSKDLCEQFAGEKAAKASKPAATGPGQAGGAANTTAEKVQNGVSKALIAKRKAGLPVVSISADLPGSTGLAAFQKENPNATIDIGVAESNMVSTAIGLSKLGFIPVVDTFAQFGVTKGALPLIMSGLSEGPMICVFSHVGFQDAADGASHQALCYLSMVCSIPHTNVYCLTSSGEAEALVSQAVDEFAAARKAGKVPHSYVFFLGRENFPPSYLPDGYQYKLGEAQVVFDNTSKHKGQVTIAAGGALLHQALTAAYELEKQNIGSIVVNPSVMHKPDVSTLATCLRNTNNKLVTVEDHQVVGGMGANIVHALVTSGLPLQAKSLGVKGEYGQSAYKASELYKKHGLDSESIVKTVKEMLK